MIWVAAGIINGKVLICQRNAEGDLPLLWEFPGGKLEEGESLEECLVRECQEELDVEIRIIGRYAETEYQYPNRVISFTFFEAVIVEGEIQVKVHNNVKWVLPVELKGYTFCPANVEIVERLSVE